MRFGVNTWVWTSPLTTAELEWLAPHVRKMGFDWIEIPIEAVGDLDYERGAAIIRDLGLGVSTCVAMGPDRDLVHPDAAIRANGIAYIQGSIDATAALGGTNVVGPHLFGGGPHLADDGRGARRDTDLLVENLGSLARYAGDRGVRMGVEPLNRFETSFINLAAQIIEVVDRVNHPSCQIMLDTFHMNIEEKSLGDAIRGGGAAAHPPPHLRERPRRAGHRQRDLAGRGSGPWRTSATTGRW